MYFSIQTSQSNQPKKDVNRKSESAGSSRSRTQRHKPLNDQSLINAIGTGLLFWKLDSQVAILNQGACRCVHAAGCIAEMSSTLSWLQLKLESVRWSCPRVESVELTEAKSLEKLYLRNLLVSIIWLFKEVYFFKIMGKRFYSYIRLNSQ